jgi:hypothetical protein
VGLPKRGSNSGASTETADWSWKFEGGRASLVGTLGDSRFCRSLAVQPSAEPGRFVLLVQRPGGQGEAAAPEPIRFHGTIEDGAFVATAENAHGEDPARISVRLVAGGDRMLVLYEKQVGTGQYARLGEVGSTRKGSSFAKRATAGRECVVTGGLGTIAVEHAGKTYYVCCTGCQDLFEQDPEGVLADFRERKAEERAKHDE